MGRCYKKMVGSEDLGVDRYNVIRVTGYWKIYVKFRIIRGKKPW